MTPLIIGAPCSMQDAKDSSSAEEQAPIQRQNLSITTHVAQVYYSTDKYVSLKLLSVDSLTEFRERVLEKLKKTVAGPGSGLLSRLLNIEGADFRLFVKGSTVGDELSKPIALDNFSKDAMQKPPLKIALVLQGKNGVRHVKHEACTVSVHLPAASKESIIAGAGQGVPEEEQKNIASRFQKSPQSVLKIVCRPEETLFEFSAKVADKLAANGTPLTDRDSYKLVLRDTLADLTETRLLDNFPLLVEKARKKAAESKQVKKGIIAAIKKRSTVGRSNPAVVLVKKKEGDYHFTDDDLDGESNAVGLNNQRYAFAMAANCSQCKKKFTAINRRHHCRKCLKSFCNAHCAHRAVVPAFHPRETVRVCDSCIVIVREEAFAGEQVEEGLYDVLMDPNI